MGLFRKLFGRGETEPGSPEAKRKADDMLLRMQGITRRAKYSGGRPVCPECGFKFPMSKADIGKEGGLNVTMCPKCNVKLGL